MTPSFGSLITNRTPTIIDLHVHPDKTKIQHTPNSRADRTASDKFGYFHPNHSSNNFRNIDVTPCNIWTPAWGSILIPRANLKQKWLMMVRLWCKSDRRKSLPRNLLQRHVNIFKWLEHWNVIWRGRSKLRRFHILLLICVVVRSIPCEPMAWMMTLPRKTI